MKKFREILSDMASWIVLSSSKVTNFTIGSVARSILEAVAIEVEQLYHFIASKFESLIDEAITRSFGFNKQSAIASTGIVTVRFVKPLTQSVVFEPGYRFYTLPLNGTVIYFKSVEQTIAPIGATEVDLLVECEQSGPVGNVPAYSITRIVSSTPFVSGAENRLKFFSGVPEESKEERQKRFNMFLNSLGRATETAIIYGCMQVPGVAGVSLKEDIGVIYLYVHDAFGNLPVPLKSQVEAKVFEYKSGGIKVIVSGVAKNTVDLQIGLAINQGYDKTAIISRVNDELIAYMNRFTVGKNLMRADLIRFVMELNKEAITNMSINLISDVAVQKNEIIRPGTITVVEMG